MSNLSATVVASASAPGIPATQLAVPAALVPLVQQFVTGNLVSPVTQATIPANVASAIAILGAGRGAAVAAAANGLRASLTGAIGAGAAPQIAAAIQSFRGVLSSPTPSNLVRAANAYNALVGTLGGNSLGAPPPELQAMHAVLSAIITGPAGRQ